MKREIEDFLNNEVKEYSMSVITDRAIASVIDGLKPSQRKIIYTADKSARKFKKTSALVGETMSIANYEKGDGSLGPAIINLVQDFTGSNNVPLLEGEGAFGSRFLPNGAASPRYTKTRLSKNFDKLFGDKELHEYNPQDGKNYEPKNFIPIIPTLLLNTCSGIAVGFACEFIPYNIRDVKDNIKRVLVGKKQKEMVPFYKGFEGTIEKNIDGKWEMSGVISGLKRNDFTITEIPVGISREAYISHLDKLEDADIIKKYTDKCSKKGFNFEVSLTHTGKQLFANKGGFLKKFRLIKTLNENLNAISEKDTLKQFKNPNEIIDYFVNYRMGVLTKRKAYKFKHHCKRAEYLMNKWLFIGDVLKKKFSLSFKSKSEMLKAMEKQNYGGYEKRLMEIPAYGFTEENHKSIKQEMDEEGEQIKFYQNVSEKELYLEDLKGLK